MTHSRDPKYHKLIKKLIKQEKTETLLSLLKELSPVETANALLQMKVQHQLRVLDSLDKETASEVLSHLYHSPVLQILVQEIKPDRVSDLVEEMPKDDAADFLAAIDEEQADEVLKGLPRKDQDEITNLMKYDEESAGGIMDPHVITATRDQTVDEAILQIRRFTEDNDIESFYTIYVVDEHRHLTGTLNVTQLLLSDGKTQVSNLMDPDVVAVDVDRDQEEVAAIAREYDLVVVPVIDKHLRLVGRITFDDLADVMSDEYNEDLGLIAGTGQEEVLDTSILKTIRDRLPWLLLALLGGFLAALAMEYYETPLASMPRVAYFVPLIAALGGNIGIQSSSIVVRGLATGQIQPSDLLSRLWKELRVGFLNGIICALCLVALAWFLSGDLAFGLSTGVALILVVCMAAAIGGSVPILLKRFNVDPALATGPFITTANDVVGVVIYLVISFSIVGAL